MTERCSSSGHCRLVKPGTLGSAAGHPAPASKSQRRHSKPRRRGPKAWVPKTELFTALRFPKKGPTIDKGPLSWTPLTICLRVRASRGEQRASRKGKRQANTRVLAFWSKNLSESSSSWHTRRLQYESKFRFREVKTAWLGCRLKGSTLMFYDSTPACGSVTICFALEISISGLANQATCDGNRFIYLTGESHRWTVSSQTVAQRLLEPMTTVIRCVVHSDAPLQWLHKGTLGEAPIPFLWGPGPLRGSQSHAVPQAPGPVGANLGPREPGPSLSQHLSE